ncbi:MAG TPA: endolytic transglycosylase MltG, partial [Thermodesulfobacteriota bacterium]|nr:endolytic transglycosylase MltG [Thermodesulfobacteriota bacterium]
MKGKKETLLLLAATGVIIIITHFYTLLYTPASHVGEGRAVTVEIPRGVSFRVIANNLEKEGLIKDSEGIVWAAYIRGAYKKVQAGEYEFSTSMTPLEILNYLTSGKIK